MTVLILILFQKMKIKGKRGGRSRRGGGVLAKMSAKMAPPKIEWSRVYCQLLAAAIRTKDGGFY